MKKFRDETGKVPLIAVLISPSFGAGWYTWNPQYKEMLFDPIVVEFILNGATENEIADYCEEKYPDAYLGGLDDLRIKWVPEGTIFRVDEYDGSETVVYQTMDEWLTA